MFFISDVFPFVSRSSFDQRYFLLTVSVTVASYLQCYWLGEVAFFPCPSHFASFALSFLVIPTRIFVSSSWSLLCQGGSNDAPLLAVKSGVSAARWLCKEHTAQQGWNAA